jgi:hypothetical protein
LATKGYQIYIQRLQKGAVQLHLLSTAEPAYPELHPYLNSVLIEILTLYMEKARRGGHTCPFLTPHVSSSIKYVVAIYIKIWTKDWHL